MSVIYKVAKWSETFETADSRKHKTLTWVSLPIDRQSNGYQSMIDQFGEDAPAIYGAWCVLLTIAAACPERGVLSSSRQDSLSIARIARMAHMPVKPFEMLFEWAIRPEIGWLIPVANEDCPSESNAPETANRLSIDCQSIDNRSLTSLPNPTQPNPTQPNDYCSEAAARPSEPHSESGRSMDEREPSRSDGTDVSDAAKQDPGSVRYPWFPTVPGRRGGEYRWRLTDDVLDSLRESFPAVDVDQACKRAHGWVIANLTRRKTASGMHDFLFRWLSKEQNRPSVSIGADSSKRRRAFV